MSFSTNPTSSSCYASSSSSSSSSSTEIPVTHGHTESRVQGVAIPVIAHVGTAPLSAMNSKSTNRANSVDRLMIEGVEMIGKGRHVEAIALFTRLIDTNPISQKALLQAHMNRGVAYSREGNFTRTIEECNYVLERAATDQVEDSLIKNARDNLGACSLAQGGALRAQEKLDEALVVYSHFVTMSEMVPVKSLGTDQQLANVLFKRGTVYRQLGKITEAINDYKRCIGMNPINEKLLIRAYDELGITYFKQQNWPEGIRYMSLIIDMKPPPEKDTLVRSYFNRAEGYKEHGKSKEAFEDYTRIVNMKLPLDMEILAKSLIQRGRILESMEKMAEGIEDYTRVITMKSPINKNVIVNALLHRAAAYKAQGKMKEALRDYNQAISKKPPSNYNVGESYLRRGELFDLKGDTDKAIEDYSTVISLASVNKKHLAQACLFRGLAFNRQGLADRAIEDLKRVNFELVVQEFSSSDLEKLTSKMDEASLILGVNGSKPFQRTLSSTPSSATVSTSSNNDLSAGATAANVTSDSESTSHSSTYSNSPQIPASSASSSSRDVNLNPTCAPTSRLNNAELAK